MTDKPPTPRDGNPTRPEKSRGTVSPIDHIERYEAIFTTPGQPETPTDTDEEPT